MDAQENRHSSRQIAADVAIVVIGFGLLYEGYRGLLAPGRWNNYAGNIVQSALNVLWAAVLMTFVAFGLRRHLSATRRT